MKTCPSDFALDDFHLHGTLTSVREHLARCESCRARMHERELLSAEFRSELAPVIPAAFRQKVRSPSARRSRRTFVACLSAAAVVVIGLFVLRSKPYHGVKGAALEVVRMRDGAIEMLEPGDRVRSGDALRFRPKASSSERYVFIGSVDGEGRFSTFYPSEGESQSVALPPAGEFLSGAVILDESSGPERIFALYSEHPLDAQVVRRAAERLPPSQLRLVLPSARQVWLVLQKDSPKH
jgi:hypothetical protein